MLDSDSTNSVFSQAFSLLAELVPVLVFASGLAASSATPALPILLVDVLCGVETEKDRDAEQTRTRKEGKSQVCIEFR